MAGSELWPQVLWLQKLESHREQLNGPSLWSVFQPFSSVQFCGLKDMHTGLQPTPPFISKSFYLLENMNLYSHKLIIFSQLLVTTIIHPVSMNLNKLDTSYKRYLTRI